MIRFAILIGFFAQTAVAQAPADTIRVTVIDAVTHAPIRRANVILNRVSQAPQDQSQQELGRMSLTAVTDASGTVRFDNASPGVYYISANHLSYPPGASERGKSLTLAAAETAETADITLALTPGAAISGHITDEDGDAIQGCSVQASPLNQPSQASASRLPRNNAFAGVDADGSYRMNSVRAGKYLISAWCRASIFEPRPLSSGPDPPPSLAWPVIYYPAGQDANSAQPVELAAGSERTGIDFRMTPRPVTHIHVSLTIAGTTAGSGIASSVTWTLESADNPLAPFQPVRPRNASDGGFDIPDVFPGSYTLLVNATPGQRATTDMYGYMHVTVGEEPVSVNLELRPPVMIQGHVEMEDGADPNLAARTISAANVAFEGDYPRMGNVNTNVKQDGSFSLEVSFPGHLAVRAPKAYMKSVTMAGRDVPEAYIDPASYAGDLKVIVSTKTAALQGTAPPGMRVVLIGTDPGSPAGFLVYTADENGRFRVDSLPPGGYLIGVSEGPPFLTDTAQQITLREGETLNVKLKEPPEEGQ